MYPARVQNERECPVYGSRETKEKEREREREEKRERGKVRWRDETGRLAYNRGVDIENLSEAE